MKRQYVKLIDSGVWHIGTRTIYAMCGRMGAMNWLSGAVVFADIAKEPDGPVCKTCIRSLAAWERDFGGDDDATE